MLCLVQSPGLMVRHIHTYFKYNFHFTIYMYGYRYIQAIGIYYTGYRYIQAIGGSLYTSEAPYNYCMLPIH